MNKLKYVFGILIINFTIFVLTPFAVIGDTIKYIVKGKSMKGYFTTVRNDIRKLHEEEIQLLLSM